MIKNIKRFDLRCIYEMYCVLDTRHFRDMNGRDFSTRIKPPA